MESKGTPIPAMVLSMALLVSCEIDLLETELALVEVKHSDTMHCDRLYSIHSDST